MLDFTKKYWVQIGGLAIRCSIVSANVCIGRVEHLKKRESFVSQEAKDFFIDQIESGKTSLPTAFPDDPKSITYLSELELFGWTVFYDVDEPIGHSIGEDLLEEDVPPTKTLEQVREETWNFIANSHEKSGLPRPEMPNYPKKEHGIDWYQIEDSSD